MKRKSTTAVFLMLASFIATSTFSQGIGVNSNGAAPDNSAVLDVQSNSKGMLIPRMTTLQRDAIAAPATGLLIFNTSTGSFWFKNKTRWVELVDSTNNIWSVKDTSIYLSDNQNVGIGTSSPEVRLHVERGTDVGAATGGYLQLGATTNPNLVFDNNEIQARNNGVPSALTLQLNGGNMGIGTAVPEAKLQISNGTDVGPEIGGFTDIVYVRMAVLTSGKAHLQLVSTDGCILLEQTLTDLTTPIQVSGLAAGTYILQINDGGSISNFTIIKK